MVKRSIEQWRALFKQQKESGVRASQFCRDNGLCPKYFSKRKKDLGWQPNTPVKPSMLKLLKPRIDTTHTIILNVGDTQLSLSLSPHTSPDWLARLIRALV